MPRLLFRRKYELFPVHLKGHVILDPSAQLAELIVYITSTRIDLYSHQSLSMLHLSNIKKNLYSSIQITDDLEENFA